MDSGRGEQGDAGPSGGSRAADIQSHLPRHHQHAVRATGRQQSNDSETTPAHDAAQGSMSIRRRTSVSEKTPARSFYHRTFHGSIGELPNLAAENIILIHTKLGDSDLKTTF